MRILLVSHFWPSYSGNSGVSLCALEHAKILIEAGHTLSILGSNPNISKENLKVENFFYIKARGSGAIYSPVFLNKDQLLAIIIKAQPDLIVVQALQTALGDESILAANQLGLPTLLISHGVSLHPYTNTPLDLLRSLAWLPYKQYKLPKLIKSLKGITTLSTHSKSTRFFDRDIANEMGIPIFHLNNFPINLNPEKVKWEKRQNDIVAIGYFSRVKNQLLTIRLFKNLTCDRSLIFIGEKSGKYYEKCVALTNKLDLQDRITFLTDRECSIAQTVANSKLILLTSITEAQPITLLEAIASGTPFVATDVGCISDIKGGFSSNQIKTILAKISVLNQERLVWEQISNEGIQHHKNFHSRHVIKETLIQIIEKITIY